MPTAVVVADAGWVVNEVLATMPPAWEVEVVGVPARVLDTVTAVDPDVVIIDLQVGNMGGMALVRHLRAELDTGSIPRLLLLLDRDADGFLAKRAGADAWLVKPFESHELRQALGGPRPEVPA